LHYHPTYARRAQSAAAVPGVCAPTEHTDMMRLLRRCPRQWMAFLGWLDAALLVLSVGVAVRLRYLADASAFAEFSRHLFLRAVLFAAATTVCMFALGLYQARTRDTLLGMLLRQFVAFALATLLLVICYYALPQAYIGRGVLALALCIGLIG